MGATRVGEDLVLAFVQARSSPVRPPARLGDQLAEGLRAGRDKFPEVLLGEAEFARWVAERCPPDCKPEETLDRLHLDDLFFAAALAKQDPAALAIFERFLLKQLQKLILRFGDGWDFTAEVTQHVRWKLFGGAIPSIRRYTGTSSFVCWLRVVATRAAIDLQRAIRAARTAPVDAEELAELVSSDADQDAEYLRHRYADSYRRALEGCLAALTPEQRGLLRMYYVQGLTLDRIGALKGVRASTILRRLHAIYDQVLTGVRRELICTGEISSSSFDSIACVVRSQLDEAISSMLAPEIASSPQD